MKERSRAVAMMVLHMSSHIASEGEYVVQQSFFKHDMKQDLLERVFHFTTVLCDL